MTARALVRQYAHALFYVAQRNGQVDRVERELAGFGQLLASHDDLSRALTTPIVTVQQKQAVVRAVVEAAGGTAPEVERLLLLLADRDRLGLVSEVATVFAERAMDTNRVVRADITSAVPLDEQVKTALVRALGEATGRKVTVTERVDPAIGGGLVAKVGSVVFDGSVARQIERIREKLLAEV